MKSNSIDFIFSEEGMLGKLGNYKRRQGQIDMAKAVQKALNNSEHLVVEAGTGTGKTFAYLIPVLLSGGRAIVATYSLTLQDQLYTKDINKLSELLRQPCSVAKIKGVGNYVCLNHLETYLHKQEGYLQEQDRYNQDPANKGYQIDMLAQFEQDYEEESGKERLSASKAIKPTVVLTEKQISIVGEYVKCLCANIDDDMASLVRDVEGGQDFKDLGEISSLKRYLRKKDLPKSIIEEICAHATIKVNFERCIGFKDCSCAVHCPYQKAKEAAKKAKVLVLNHAMFCRLADGQRIETDDKEGFEGGEESRDSNKGLFKNFNLCVIDEAHHFPQVVKDTFSRELTKESFEHVFAQLHTSLIALLDINGVNNTICNKIEEIFALCDKSKEDVEAFAKFLKESFPVSEKFYYSDNVNPNQDREDVLMDGTKVYGLGQQAFNLAKNFHELYQLVDGFINVYCNFEASALDRLYDTRCALGAYSYNSQEAVLYGNISDRELQHAVKRLTDKKTAPNYQKKGLEWFKKLYREANNALTFTADAMVEVGQFMEQYFVEVLFGRNFDASQEYRSALWYQREDRTGFRLVIAPFCAGFDFRNRIMDIKCFEDTGFVFTSATISTGCKKANLSAEKDKSLEADIQLEDFKKELDLPNYETSSLLAASPFDYLHQGLLYVPEIFNKFPDPNRMKAYDIVQGIAPVLKRVKGGVLVLCTSMRAVSYFADALRYSSQLKGRLILKQEEKSDKNALVSEFRENGNAILIGTKSFWEGVDIQGPALSAVVIDKLPFPAPSVAIKAEREFAESVQHARSSFMAIDLPRAIIELKQGVGRLIRCESDKGIVIICDPRLLKQKGKSYREQIISALPNFSYTENEPVVLDFLGKIKVEKYT